jgi:DNA replication and repair protein RecF
MTQDGETAFGIQIQLGDNKLSTGTVPGNARRQILTNDNAITQHELRDYLSLLWLTPEDDFVLGSHAARRQLLDRWISALDPQHHGRTQQLQKQMSERLRLLSQPHADGAWLSAIEKNIAERGTAIAAARIEMVTALAPFLSNAPAGLPPVQTTLNGDIEKLLQDKPALWVEEHYAQILAQNRHEDSARGQTQYGVHRTDWQITELARKQPIERCSTGEQKTVLFALLMAAAQRIAAHDNRPPILLLDECLSHLDSGRQTAVLAHMAQLGSQCFWTGVARAQNESLYVEL